MRGKVVDGKLICVGKEPLVSREDVWPVRVGLRLEGAVKGGA